MRHVRRTLLWGLVALAILSAACSNDLTITTTALPDGAVGVKYAFQLTGNEVDRWSLLSGNLPPGLQLKPEDGTLSGTPTLAGVFTFTVIALRQPTSAPTQSLTQGLSLTVR